MSDLYGQPTNVKPRSTAPRDAAGVLREARRRLDAGLDAADACGWAISVLPESPAAQRLMADWFLCSGQFEQAATLTRTLLRQRSDDSRLWRRRAQALLATERLDEAFEAVDRALAPKPNHRGTLLLAATISSRLGDDAGALALVERADEQHPRHPEVARRLVQALLANHRPDDALAILDQLEHAEPELRAQALRAQGRLLEARLLLEEAIRFEPDDSRRDRLALELIDALEAAGDWPALRQMQARPDDSPALMPRMAESCLAMGDFDRARDLLAGSAARSAEYAHVETALLAASGDSDEALTRLASLGLLDRDIDPVRRTAPWLRCTLGLVVAEQIDSRSVRRAGGDPTISVLGDLLTAAIGSLDRALAEQSDAADAEVWMSMRDACAGARSGELPRESSEQSPPAMPLRRAA